MKENAKQMVYPTGMTGEEVVNEYWITQGIPAPMPATANQPANADASGSYTSNKSQK